MQLTRRIFLGWASFIGYGIAELVRPPHAHAGGKRRVFPDAATATGTADAATVEVGAQADAATGTGVAFDTPVGPNDPYGDTYTDLYEVA